MDHERLLISRMVQDHDMLGVTESGIDAEHFLDPSNRQVFAAILAYNTEHGSVPTLRRIKRDFPNYNFTVVEEPVDDLMALVRKYHRLSVLEDAISSAVDAYDLEKDEEVQRLLHTALGKLIQDAPRMRDSDYTQTGEARLARYESYRNSDNGLRGISSGFDSIDRATQGFQPQQLVTFVGPPKAGKSTTMLLAARAAHLAGRTPLLIGFEMSNEEQEERLDCIAAKINHNRLRNATLHKDEKERLVKSVHQISAMKPFILSNDSQSTTVISGIAAKAEKYKPDILIVDGVYMMQDENGESPGSPQALTNITRGFKRMAQNLNIPIIITTQVLTWKMDKKKGITDNSIGYSSSFAQDSDVIIGVERTEDPGVNKIKIVLARNAPPMETFVNWDWETGTFEEMPDYQGDQDGLSGADF